MNRVREVRKCIRCGESFHRHGGNVNAKYCSRKCACRDRNTKEHQVVAGKAGGGVKILLRGTGTRGYVKEYGRHQHRVVAEKVLGRKLKKGEIVHHIDENKHNNDPRNLAVIDRADHARIHWYGKSKRKTRALRSSS